MLNGTGEEIATKLRRLCPVEPDQVPSPPPQMARVVSVCNPKNGTARTTTAVFLAHALIQQGRRVLLVDADPDEAALTWSRLAPFRFPTAAAPVRYLHKLLPDLAAEVDHVVIDTPARRKYAAVRRSAMFAADLIVVPMAPTVIELDVTTAVFTEIAAVARQRGGEPAAAVLLNRVIPQAASTDAYRVVLAEWGHRVLPTAVPGRELYAQAFGAPVTDPGAYLAVAGDLLSPPDPRRPRLACAAGPNRR